MKKRRQETSPERVATVHTVPTVPVLSIEQQYKIYQKDLTEFYKVNKKKYVSPLFEKLVACGIFTRETNVAKDVPWQLVKMQAKTDFDKDRTP